MEKNTFTKDTMPIKLNFEKQYFAVKCLYRHSFISDWNGLDLS